MEKLNIDGRLVGSGEPPYIVAEIGANHNGDMGLCTKLIEAAKECGADAVKFQSWTKQSLFSKGTYARDRQQPGRDASSPALEEVVEQYALTAEQHKLVAAHCRKVGITFYSSCFSPHEVDLLESLDAPVYKIASMDVNHLPLLEYVAKKGRPVILSTGMATLGEVERALGVLRDNRSGPVALLHCISIYPCPPEIINLRNIPMLQQAFDVPVGFSDHTLGTHIPLAALALGACTVEKHFTLDKTMEGWDHSISADPEEMSKLVRESRAVFEALGSTVRTVNRLEMEKRHAFRRRMVTTRAIRQGEKLSVADIDFKRPGTGLHPDELRYVLGRTLARDLNSGQELEWSDLL
jgi:N,N'-diacetyllegionaminate synthase